MKLNPATLARIAELTGTKLPVISEADFTDAVIQFARDRQWLAVHFRPAVVRSGKWATHGSGDVAGWPDVVAVRGARVIAAELKIGTNKPTAAQRTWLTALQAANVETYLWSWPDDWGEVERVLS
jgi:hypothetical protein